MLTLTTIGLYGLTFTGIHLVVILPAVYVAYKNEQKPFLLPWILTIVLLPLIGVIVYTAVYFNRQKNRGRYEALLLKKPGEGTTDQDSRENTTGIPDRIVTHILRCLNDFEKEEAYLEPGISLTSLTDTFDTDPRYVNKVIKTYKKKRFKTYINTLKVDYLVNKIRSGDDLRKYTSKAAARELGFGSTRAFSLAFLRRTGMYHYSFVEKFETTGEEQWAF